jgi:hypothetical protein
VHPGVLAGARGIAADFLRQGGGHQCAARTC